VKKSMLILTMLFILLSRLIFAFDQFDCIEEFKFDLSNFPNNISSQQYILLSCSFLFDEPVNSVFPRYGFFEAINNMDLLDFGMLAVGVSLAVLPFDSYVACTILESFSVTALITGAIKFIVGRGRPYMEKSAFVFKPFSTMEGYQSFPSGHSALSWAIFTPVAKMFGDYWYAIPTLFSLQRLWSNNHWSSDVIYGGLIGFSIGSSFFDLKSNNSH